jgi:hypothetical protein
MLIQPWADDWPLDTQTAYLVMVGQLLSWIAQVEQHSDEVLALSYGAGPEHRQRLADEVLIKVSLDSKIQHLRTLSDQLFGADHTTSKFLRVRWPDVLKFRTLVAHGYYVTNHGKRAVSVHTGLRRKGYRSERIDLAELAAATLDAQEAVLHVTCIYATMPESDVSPMNYDDLD